MRAVAECRAESSDAAAEEEKHPRDDGDGCDAHSTDVTQSVVGVGGLRRDLTAE